jgi:hypothetical protein
MTTLTKAERRVKWAAILLTGFVIFAALMTAANAQTANTVSFNLTTAISADRQTLTPTLTWATTPAATTCTASGDTAWSGSKAASGTVTLASFPATESRGYVLVCNWPGDTQAALTWVPPTTFEDGSPLPKCATATTAEQCLAGYVVEFGTTTALGQSRFHMFPNSTSTPVTGLTPGSTYHFAIRAITGLGAQSARSNMVNKTLAQSVQVSQQSGIKLPSAPVLN